MHNTWDAYCIKRVPGGPCAAGARCPTCSGEHAWGGAPASPQDAAQGDPEPLCKICGTPISGFLREYQAHMRAHAHPPGSCVPVAQVERCDPNDMDEGSDQMQTPDQIAAAAIRELLPHADKALETLVWLMQDHDFPERFIEPLSDEVERLRAWVPADDAAPARHRGADTVSRWWLEADDTPAPPASPQDASGTLDYDDVSDEDELVTWEQPRIAHPPCVPLAQVEKLATAAESLLRGLRLLLPARAFVEGTSAGDLAAAVAAIKGEK